MFNQIFDETLIHFGIKNKELAEAYQCHDDYISKIRRSKKFPGLINFWRLLQTLDSLCPGALEYFGLLLAGSNLVDSNVSSRGVILEEIIYQLDPEEIVYLLTNEKLPDFALALNERLESIPSFRYSYLSMCDRSSLLMLTRNLVVRLKEEQKLVYLIEAADEEDLSELLVLAAKKLTRINRQHRLDKSVLHQL